ncbi:MAG: hypothetical protein F4Y71_12260 [Acidobacteria bacterium]|nr:hypothetical protein [Acidobacteriota bacterium]
MLRAGDSCTYPGTSQTLTINADGTATFGFVTSGAAISISSNNITLVATRQNDGSWLVQQVGAESLNRAPRAVGSVPDQALTEGGAPATVELSGYFEDPDGDNLNYRASSSSPAAVRVSVSGSTLTLAPVAVASATITVTATDPAGLSGTQRFEVSVSAPPTGEATTFGAGERIPTFPEGFDAIPNVSRGGVSVSVEAGRVRIGMQRGAYLEYDDYRYTCNASRCEIENGVVTEGEIVRTLPGESGGGATGNRAPRAVGRIADQTLTDGGSPRTLDVSEHFEDPDGDDLTYRASSSRTSVVRVSVSGSEITLSPRDEGTATVTVTATDPDGRSATQRFDVTVGAGGGTTGAAAEAELTSCPANTSDFGNVRFTLRGTVTANRRLTDVQVHGCAGRTRGGSCEDDPFNFDYIGTDRLGTMEPGTSKEFEISGSPRIPVFVVSGLSYHCWARLEYREGGATLTGTETSLTVDGIETRLRRN